MDRVGFIGLGRMGGGMAAMLAGAGVPLTVHDVDAARAEALVARGASTASSPAEVAARSDVVILCVPSSPEVREALFAEPGGVLAGAAGPLAIIDATTQNYYETLEIAKTCEAAGHGYSDCPVSGMPHRAADGSLTIMFGGTDAAFERARPLLDAMGDFVVHCGDVGMGQVMKAINNVIYNVNIAALCELLPLAVKVGLDVHRVAEVVTTASARSFASEYFVPRILERKFEYDFSMASAYKDIVNVQEIATRLGAAIPVASAMTATYQHTMAMGHGDEPKSAMIKLYERVLGIEVEG